MNLGRNVVWGLGENIIRILVTFFVNVLIARHLGPESYGVLTAAFVVVNLASAFGGLGLDSVVIRELSDKDEVPNKILGSAFRLRIVSSLVSLIVLLALSAFNSSGLSSVWGSMWGAVLIMMLLIPLQPLAFGYGNAFTAHLRADLLTVSKTIGLVVATIGRVTGLILGFSFLYFATCHIVEHLVSTIIVRRAYKKELQEKIGSWEFDQKTVKVLVDGGKWLFLSAVIVSLVQGAGVLLLKTLSSGYETGTYAAAMRLALVLQFVPAVVCKTFLPVIVTSRSESSMSRSSALEGELFKVLWLFGYSASAFFLLFGDLLVPVILGEEYRSSAEPLKILAVTLIPLSVGAARTVYFAKNRAYKKILAADVSGAVFTIAFGCLWIPKYGAIGAAYSSLFAAVIGYLIVPYVLLERGKESSRTVLKGALFPFPNFKVLFKAKLSS